MDWVWLALVYPWRWWWWCHFHKILIWCFMKHAGHFFTQQCRNSNIICWFLVPFRHMQLSQMRFLMRQKNQIVCANVDKTSFLRRRSSQLPSTCITWIKMTIAPPWILMHYFIPFGLNKLMIFYREKLSTFLWIFSKLRWGVWWWLAWSVIQHCWQFSFIEKWSWTWYSEWKHEDAACSWR